MSSQDVSSCFLQLPWDDIVFPRIFSALTMKDVFNLLKSSKKFHGLVIAYMNQLTELSTLDVEDLDLSDVEFLANNTSAVKKLDLEAAQLTDEIVHSFLGSNKQLTYVNLSGTSLRPTALYNLIHCNLLRNLNLENCLWLTSECLSTIHYHCKNLETSVSVHTGPPAKSKRRQ